MYTHMQRRPEDVAHAHTGMRGIQYAHAGHVDHVLTLTDKIRRTGTGTILQLKYVYYSNTVQGGFHISKQIATASPLPLVRGQVI